MTESFPESFVESFTAKSLETGEEKARRSSAQVEACDPGDVALSLEKRGRMGRAFGPKRVRAPREIGLLPLLANAPAPLLRETLQLAFYSISSAPQLSICAVLRAMGSSKSWFHKRGLPL